MFAVKFWLLCVYPDRDPQALQEKEDPVETKEGLYVTCTRKKKAKSKHKNIGAIGVYSKNLEGILSAITIKSKY